MTVRDLVAISRRALGPRRLLRRDRRVACHQLEPEPPPDERPPLKPEDRDEDPPPDDRDEKLEVEVDGRVRAEV